METAEQSVLIIGGTQGTGLLIVHRLLQEGYRVRALARNEAKARERFRPEVEVVAGDVTKPETLLPALKGADHLIYTVGITRRTADEPLVKATAYDGLCNTLAAAQEAGFCGRFLYMTAMGITRPSMASAFLNRLKKNLFLWRGRAEEAIRRSGLDYTIIRAGILTDSPAGQREIVIGQEELPLAFRYKIGRADAAEVFVEALRHPATCRTTFDLYEGRGASRKGWDSLFGSLKPDRDGPVT